MMAEPTAASMQVSQLLAGHAVDVLVRDGAWLKVAGFDSYAGWVHAGYLGGTARGGNGTPPCGWQVSRLLSLGCTARTPAGAHLRLPLGAHLPRSSLLETGEALPLAARRTAFPATADAILGSAERFFAGTPYVWGGITPWGADCSGFVQSVYALHGTRVPRDAWQQATAGQPVDPDDVRPGDLLFFATPGTARITHVAIAAGGNAAVHLSVSRGGFAVDRLSRGDQVSRSLAACYKFARRVLE
jgi:hypothetical protein